MKKIAVCFRGEIRTGAYTIENIKNFLGSLYSHCDFFIHTWDENIRKPLHQQSFGEKEALEVQHNIGPWKVSESDWEIITKEYKPKLFLIENFAHLNSRVYAKHSSKYIENNHPEWFIPRFYTWYKVVQLKKEFEKFYNFKYDYVLVIRFDNIFRNNITLQKFIDNMDITKFAANGIFGDNKDTLDDMFFLASSEVMDQACEYYNYRLDNAYEEDRLYNSNHTQLHSPFFYFLKNRNLGPQSLDLLYFSYDLSVLREECIHFDPVKQFDDCRQCDLYHYHVSEHGHHPWFLQDEEKMIDTARRTLKNRMYLPPAYRKFNDKL